MSDIQPRPDAQKSGAPEVPVQRAVEKLTESPKFRESAEMMMGMMGMGNPLHQKMNEEHISQALKLGADHDEREYNLSKTQLEHEDKKGQRTQYLHFFAFCIIIGLFIFLACWFSQKPELLVPILTGLGGLFSGFVAGMGYGKSKRD